MGGSKREDSEDCPKIASTLTFDRVLARSDCKHPVRARTTTLQINLGKVCNQSCAHCHVEAGPTRDEIMAPDVVARTLKVLASSKHVSNVDITGGAPELNPSFRQLVMEVHKLGYHIVDRCNLTVLTEPGMEKVLEFLAEHRVEICASLPCYTADNVDRQRGRGTFARSIVAIRLLNALGYGMPDSNLRLNLVYNPLGSFLPPPQEQLEDEYRQQLLERYGVVFHQLFTITNMPIGRFAASLCQSGRFDAYMALLVNHFNPRALSNLMCRSLVSVGYDGKLYDCDFNQMLGIGIGEKSVWTIRSFGDVEGERIFTGRHCFGCTAGCGSSCEGALQ